MNIGEFYNVTEIGQGGMGTVYSGYYNGQKVAIKEIRRDYLSENELIDRFRLEARVIDKLNHPSIVKIVKPATYPSMTYYPAFEYNGNLYIAMEFVDGLTLEKYVMQRNGPLSEHEATHFMLDILDAMEYIRRQNIVHRDIKPSNIIIRPDNSVCIIDFGIVKDMKGRGLTTGRSVIGTNGYMSPEQAEGLSVDNRTDIYSLGCVLFFMITGTHAIKKKESDFETRLSIIKDTFPRAKDINPSISDKIQNIIDRAVNKNMLLRYQSPYEFKMDLISSNPTAIINKDEDSISIGRDKSCDIVIEDPQEKVSRRHIDIRLQVNTGDADTYIFTDRSTNGSMINGKFIHGESINIRENELNDKSVLILSGIVAVEWNDIKKAFNGKRQIHGCQNSDTVKIWKKPLISMISGAGLAIIGIIATSISTNTIYIGAIAVGIIYFITYLIKLIVCISKK